MVEMCTSQSAKGRVARRGVAAFVCDDDQVEVIFVGDRLGAAPDTGDARERSVTAEARNSPAKNRKGSALLRRVDFVAMAIT